MKQRPCGVWAKRPGGVWVKRPGGAVNQTTGWKRGAAAVLALWACSGPATDPPALGQLPAWGGPLDALNRRHARLRERMRRRGYGEQKGLARVFALEGDGVAFPLDLPVGSCSTFVALGGGRVRDLELSLYDGEGAEIANDPVPAEGGLVHVCPQAGPAVATLPHYLRLVAREGTGALLVAHFESAPEGGEGFDGLFEGILAPRVPFRDVEESLSFARTALRSRGFTPVAPPFLQRVAEDGVVRLPHALSKGRCYVALGRGGEGLSDIDFFLFDPAGVEVARDVSSNAEPTIEHCPAEAGRFTVELRTFEGAGAVGILLAEGPAPQLSPEQPGPVDARRNQAGGDPAVALEVLSAPLAERGFGPPVFVSRDAIIAPGEVRTHDIVVGPGCAIVAGAASHEGLDLDLYLATVEGRELDRDTAVHSTARVRACRPAATVMRVAVKGYGRDGSYALALLRAPANVDQLKALRLEEVSAPYRLRGYRERAVWAARLSESAQLRRDVNVEAGECVALVAAGDASVLDLDLFLRDRTGTLVASSSGPAPQAAVSRCASSRERLALEVVMYRGSGTASVVLLSRSPSDRNR